MFLLQALGRRDRSLKEDILRLRKSLNSLPKPEDGSVASFLHDVDPTQRRQMFAGAIGSQLAVNLSRQAVGSDYYSDAAFLRRVFREDCAAGSAPGSPAARAWRVSRKITVDSRMAHAAHMLSSAKLQPEFTAGRLPSIAKGLLMAGELPYASYIKDFPKASISQNDLEQLCKRGHVLLSELHLSDVSPMIQNGLLTCEQWLDCGLICDADLTHAVTQEIITVAHATRPGPNQYNIIVALAHEHLIALDDAIKDVVQCWQPENIFPTFLRQKIHSFRAQAEFLNGFLLYVKPGEPRNKPLLMRALAVWTLRNLMQTIDVPFALEVASTRQSLQCIICKDAVKDEQGLFKLKDCTHTARMDRQCYDRGLEMTDGLRCPDHTCNRLLDPNEILSLTGSVERARHVAAVHVADFRENIHDWRNCATAGCANGMTVAFNEQKTLNCRCCGQTTELLNTTKSPLVARKELIASMTLSDLANLCWLVRGACATRVSRHTPHDKRPQRECYGCGVTTIHTSGCTHMICTNHTHGTDSHIPVTTKDWHWVKGFFTRGFGSYGEQRYRPWKNSELAKYFLFGDIEPGATDVAVCPTLVSELERLKQDYFLFHGEQGVIDSGFNFSSRPDY